MDFLSNLIAKLLVPNKLPCKVKIGLWYLPPRLLISILGSAITSNNNAKQPIPPIKTARNVPSCCQRLPYMLVELAS